MIEIAIFDQHQCFRQQRRYILELHEHTILIGGEHAAEGHGFEPREVEQIIFAVAQVDHARIGNMHDQLLRRFCFVFKRKGAPINLECRALADLIARLLQNAAATITEQIELALKIIGR